MQRLSSFSHAWTHVGKYRAQSLLPCPFYHKSQSNKASNHKSTEEATIISLFADSASPSCSSRNHLTALSWTDDTIVYEQYQYIYASFGSTDFLDANKAVVSACRRQLRTTYRGLPQWCAPLNALRKTTAFEISSTSPQWGRKSNIVTTSIFCTQGQYIKIKICKRPLTLIEVKLMGFASYQRPRTLIYPCMHAEVRRLVCVALH